MNKYFKKFSALFLALMLVLGLGITQNGIVSNAATNPSQTVFSLSITPATMSKAKGEQQQLQVIATMGDGSTKDVTSAGATYTTNSASVATVDTNGLVTVSSTTTTGYKATITAAYGGKTVTSIVTVIDDPSKIVSSLSVTPATMSKAKGEQQQLQVIATMGDGSTKDVTSAGATYTTNSALVATVDTNGLVTVSSTTTTGYKATITAAYGGKTATSIVTVIDDPSKIVSSLSVTPATMSKAKGEQQQLQVIATMGDGSTKDVTSAGTTYTTNSATVATVNTNGLVTIASTATTGYKATITATYGGKTATSIVTVVDDPSKIVSSLSVTPSTMSKAKGEQQQLQVIATMGDGSTKDVTSAGATYTTNSATVATVDTNGLVTVSSTTTTGYKAYITATYGGKTATSIVTVVDDPSKTIVSLAINPSTVTLGRGEQQQLIVIATMKDGSTKDITSGSAGTTYTLSNTGVATVDADGLVTVTPTATNGAKTTITVTNQNSTISCTVTVHYDVTVSSISVNPTATTLVKGNQRQLIVTATMSDGSAEDVTNGGNGTIYSSSNIDIATVDANGLITISSIANTGDKATITVSYGGATTTSEITVSDTCTYNISIDSKYVSYTSGKLIYGYVKDSDGNEVANENVYVAYYSNGGIPKDNESISDEYTQVETDKTGYFSFYVYKPGFYLAYLSPEANSVRNYNYVSIIDLNT